MKGIIFAAGIGSRLKPFTEHHPKALAPVHGVPMLEHVIIKLKKAGCDGLVINVHHFAGQIIDFLAEHDNFGIDIEISDETSLLLDTGGALAKIFRESRIIAALDNDETVLIHNADILTDFPVGELIGAAGGNTAAILVNPQRASSRRFLFDSCMFLRGWTNLSNGAVRPAGLDPAGLLPAAFGGVHAMPKSTLGDISCYCGAELHPFSIVDFYLDACRSERIRGFVPAENYHWFDIGTPEKIAQAEAAIAF